MKFQKGITLISLTIYLIAMVIIIAVITVITGYFYKNVDISNENEEINKQYTRFNSYFSEEVNRKNNKVIECKTIDDKSVENDKISYIALSSGNQYTYIEKNKAIYLNNIKIASHVEDCEFIETIGTEGNEESMAKYYIEVKLNINGKDKTGIYTLKD